MAVVKWLIISMVVLLGFSLVLLGLGQLLHDNEQRVAAYKSESFAKAEDQVTNIENTVTAVEQQQASTLLPIIRQNLTCVSDEQCVIVSAQFVDKKCQLAINTIGAAKLAKAPAEKTAIKSCEQYGDSAQAVCRNNFCAIE